MARLSGSSGRYAPESGGPIMLTLSFVVHDAKLTPSWFLRESNLQTAYSWFQSAIVVEPADLVIA
jgi:hypothetical protein